MCIWLYEQASLVSGDDEPMFTASSKYHDHDHDHHPQQQQMLPQPPYTLVVYSVSMQVAAGSNSVLRDSVLGKVRGHTWRYAHPPFVHSGPLTSIICIQMQCLTV